MTTVAANPEDQPTPKQIEKLIDEHNLEVRMDSVRAFIPKPDGDAGDYVLDEWEWQYLDEQAYYCNEHGKYFDTWEEALAHLTEKGPVENG